MTAPNDEQLQKDDIFGTYVSSWVAWAVDPQIRNAGSSAGVLTALSNWLISTGRVNSVKASAEGQSDPRRTVPLTITSREEALIAAGSRYAPVANLSNLTREDFRDSAIVGKPCEASAIRQYADALQIPKEDHPIVMSFFCAGTPSQHATNALAELLEAPVDEIESLRYRGNGWPGEFAITLTSGDKKTMSYDKSWGTYLGRTVQWRCKICVDGTGGHSDIAVGDYWEVDQKGYPTFENADGRSVVIARTARGDELLQLAVSTGVIVTEPLNLSHVAAVQPLQTDRKQTLAARLAGRRIAGKRVPRYRGYGLIRIAKTTGKRNIRAFAGTFVRTRQNR
ncbi:Coenzyme F420 hydrogenase/dehydrogenase, beta subunit C-terminal domain [Rhodococcoides fascians]|uniref:Coenzyme F420 hydrogenase/dehydrogenase, beta subunit C-terminal domain n=1 Tax=Rhodococcoides fascians TaxID=1828 RepID=UPI001E3C8105|nr:Coenzyme F420 hydrogenase/dehydrogenase, beta subunit C-terminal domain [Rhodococcus fascians]